jgi:hypothetical protein
VFDMKRTRIGGAMNWKTSRRLIRRLGLALAVTAFTAPAAQAMPVISAEGGTAAAPRVSYPDDLHATVPHVPVLNVTYPADIVRPVSSEPSDSLGRPLTPPEQTDSLGRPLGRPDLVQPTSDVVSDSSRFDWTHVGIGFFALGLMLLGGGALIIGRQNRRSRLAAA